MSLGLGNVIVQQKSSGGAGTGNLQAVTDIGNTTTNNIELLYPDEGSNSLNFRNVNNVVGVNKATLEIDTNEYLQLKYNIYGAVSTNIGLQFSGDSQIRSYIGGVFMGLALDFTNHSYSLGDFDSNYNSTYIEVNDALQRISVSNNLITTSAGSNVSQHLSIYVSGVHYKIQLKNP